MSIQISSADLSVAANATSANQAADTQLAYMPYNANLVVAANGAAAGLRMSLIVGDQAVIQDQPISALNRFPIRDDFLTNSGAVQNDRLVLTFRNTTGAAIVVQYVVKAVPVA